MTAPTKEMIADAVFENRPPSRETILDRLFASMFSGLVYPQIWEDPVCDMRALDLDGTDDVVCIASGGCNVMSYLTRGPASVTAVDLSPWHVQLNRLKLAAVQHVPDHRTFYDLFGHADRSENTDVLDRYILPHLDAEAQAFWNGRAPLGRRKGLFARGFYRFGALGSFIGVIHGICRLARVNLREVLAARTLAEQAAFFDARIAPLIDSAPVRLVVRRRAALFGLGIPPAQYDKLAADAGGDVLPVLKARARKLFCDFPIAENYFVWQAVNRAYKADGTGPVPPYLEAQHFAAVRAAAHRVVVHNRSVTDVLADADARSKSIFILLDAQDWMTDAQLNALWDQITRTARPGARVLFRTGGRDDILPGRVASAVLDRWAYDATASAEAFATDRSAIYGGVHLYRLKG
ncbi:S-adenosylmethionine--diacylglycerol 3-amino-3-carboxypropyl transferase [Jannaschia pagri]|uniref:S-adenosylmethionine--diacylglycerol 3-amino-3-carboxypropyl transferase n=1 Tax=Jannaschia pagri TaxID=2829797 RepID=A0ABQ4NK71_9RHOB|nr:MULTISPECIES: DUF3419 family protein [unclassified Jannaschia]GIT90803.1 S-adenosylmethionine--diacylglycerol 3-amino-3-carboxypropyl transferase [Jannaschia sp. AI_61]GIT94635.1 S-adenosylmethionine--diacylglycerol 3-amino-3-carboxypropyl transferase [Jannaschia sp. AI_62]